MRLKVVGVVSTLGFLGIVLISALLNLFGSMQIAMAQASPTLGPGLPANYDVELLNFVTSNLTFTLSGNGQTYTRTLYAATPNGTNASIGHLPAGSYSYQVTGGGFKQCGGSDLRWQNGSG